MNNLDSRMNPLFIIMIHESSSGTVVSSIGSAALHNVSIACFYGRARLNIVSAVLCALRSSASMCAHKCENVVHSGWQRALRSIPLARSAVCVSINTFPESRQSERIGAPPGGRRECGVHSFGCVCSLNAVNYGLAENEKTINVITGGTHVPILQ